MHPCDPQRAFIYRGRNIRRREKPRITPEHGESVSLSDLITNIESGRKPVPVDRWIVSAAFWAFKY